MTLTEEEGRIGKQVGCSRERYDEALDEAGDGGDGSETDGEDLGVEGGEGVGLIIILFLWRLHATPIEEDEREDAYEYVVDSLGEGGREEVESDVHESVLLLVL